MMKYDRRLDRGIGHDYPGVRSPGFVRWELDEIELGYRVACALDDPDQTWWELIGNHMLRKMEQDEAAALNTGNTNDDSVGGVRP